MRRFGPGPYLIGLRRVPERWGSGFPFDVPAVAAVEDMRPDAPVTLLAGDNGTGKAALVEAVAEAVGFAGRGGGVPRAGGVPAVPRGAPAGGLRPGLSPPEPRVGRLPPRARARPVADEAPDRLLPARRELLQRRVARRQRRPPRPRPLALRRRPAARAVARPVVPRARREPVRRRGLLRPRRAGGGALGDRRDRAARDRRARRRGRRAVRHRHPLADPARLPRRADLPARRRRPQPDRLRRPRCRPAHARLPRGARALPARGAGRGLSGAAQRSATYSDCAESPIVPRSS